MHVRAREAVERLVRRVAIPNEVHGGAQCACQIEQLGHTARVDAERTPEIGLEDVEADDHDLALAGLEEPNAHVLGRAISSLICIARP